MKKQELHPRTAIINKNQKNLSKRARCIALSWLSKKFPEAFDNSLRIRPLKIGIMDDILCYSDEAAKDLLSKSQLRSAVVLFARRIDYLACLKAGEMRIDLQGKICSKVTQEEADAAAVKIKKRVEKGVRNARKIKAEKNRTSSFVYPSSPIQDSKLTNTSEDNADYLPTYPLRSATYGGIQNTQASSPSKAATVIKHKATRQYDPGTVARLKEKLGLSREAKEVKKEEVE